MRTYTELKDEAIEALKKHYEERADELAKRPAEDDYWTAYLAIDDLHWFETELAASLLKEYSAQQASEGNVAEEYTTRQRNVYLHNGGDSDSCGISEHNFTSTLSMEKEVEFLDKCFRRRKNADVVVAEIVIKTTLTQKIYKKVNLGGEDDKV